LIDDDGYIYDGMGADEIFYTKKDRKRDIWSYNPGVLIAALHQLHIITHS
jgi:hypothetical protein